MNVRVRMALLAAGLALIGFALTALFYALWPQASLNLQVTLEPTLFLPP